MILRYPTKFLAFGFARFHSSFSRNQYHKSGSSGQKKSGVRDFKPDTVRWESENKRDVRDLISLIEKIVAVIKAKYTGTKAGSPISIWGLG